MFKTKENKKLHKHHEMKSTVETAIKNHKTFTVLGGFTCVKDALKIRGWVEKYQKSRTCYHMMFNKQSDVQDIEPNKLENEFLLSQLLKDYSVDLLWTLRNELIDWKKIGIQTMVSRFIRADFKTKAGLCNSLQHMHWYIEPGASYVSFPRCYDVSNAEEFATFANDFRITACTGFIKYIYESDNSKTVIFSSGGKIPLSSFEFAVSRCLEYVASQEHEDIDYSIPKVWDHLWDQFLTSYYSLVHENGSFLYTNREDFDDMYVKSKMLLQKFMPYWPQFHLDGTHSLWILKPAAKSRGRGILIMSKFEHIVSKIGSFHSKDSKYVIQKYIERPLLIYDTKFDIRQWFLVTCAYPLTVWMYKESYLRFCSQIFNLIDTHESIHLSNNAVQCKYKNGKRDRNLPDENMWDCYTFQAYLRSKGKSNLWNDVIYPGMKENIIGTLLASQNTMDKRKNCFELFGADFMLADDFIPWLIEINSGPAMSPSTSVTARMCSQVLEDVIKVVIDRKDNKCANTGMFELIYKQIIPSVQPYMGQNLIVQGTKFGNSSFKSKNRSGKRKRNGYIKMHVEARNCAKMTCLKEMTLCGDIPEISKNVPVIYELKNTKQEVQNISMKNVTNLTANDRVGNKENEDNINTLCNNNYECGDSIVNNCVNIIFDDNCMETIRSSNSYTNVSDINDSKNEGSNYDSKNTKNGKKSKIESKNENHIGSHCNDCNNDAGCIGKDNKEHHKDISNGYYVNNSNCYYEGNDCHEENNNNLSNDHVRDTKTSSVNIVDHDHDEYDDKIRKQPGSKRSKEDVENRFICCSKNEITSVKRQLEYERLLNNWKKEMDNSSKKFTVCETNKLSTLNVHLGVDGNASQNLCSNRFPSVNSKITEASKNVTSQKSHYQKLFPRIS